MIITENVSTNEIRPLAFHSLDTESLKFLGWNLPPEAMHLVHTHWQGYPAPPFYAHLILAVIYFILMVSSTIGNGIVIWIFTTSKSLRTPSNLFIVNLAIFDLLMMFEMPMFLVNSFTETIIGYDLGCTIYAALGSVSGIGASISNAVISFDRYRTISNPMRGRLNLTQARLLVLLTWLWTFPFTVFPIIKIWGRYIPEGYLTTCSFDYLSDDDDTKAFVACIFGWSYCIPMMLICINYSNLYKHIRIHENMLKDQAKRMNVKSFSANASSTSAEIRVAKAAFTIFFLFVCAWTPYAIVAMIGAFGDQQLLTPTATMIPALACKIVSCIDPWIYAISHPRYRKELEKRLPWLGIVEEPENESDISTIATGIK